MPDNEQLPPITYSVVSNGKATTLSVVTSTLSVLGQEDPRYTEVLNLITTSDTTSPEVRKRLDALLNGEELDEPDEDDADLLKLSDRVSVDRSEGTVLIDGTEFDNHAAALLSDIVLDEETPQQEALIAPFVRFVTALSDLSSRPNTDDIIDRLYSWVEHHDLTLTTEGALLAGAEIPEGTGAKAGQSALPLQMHTDGTLVVPVIGTDEGNAKLVVDLVDIVAVPENLANPLSVGKVRVLEINGLRQTSIDFFYEDNAADRRIAEIGHGGNVLDATALKVNITSQ